MTDVGPTSSSALQRPGFRLSEFLAPQSVQLNLAATTREDAFEELVALLPIGPSQRRLAIEVLTQRESAGSTGIGMGVAIPHGRSTIFSRIMVAFGRSEKGIVYPSVDRKKVRLIFLIVSPTLEIANQYHHALAAIVNLTKEEHNRKRLLEAESATEVRAILAEAVS